MRTLSLSLLAIILIATVGLGWLFDRVYEQYTTKEQNQNVNAIHILEKFGSDLAVTLEKLPNRRQFIQHWPTQEQYDLTLMPLGDFPLPNKLLKQLKLGKPLLLETDNNLAFHYYLVSSDELLIVKSPLLNIEQTDNYIFTVLFYLALLLLFIFWLSPLINRLVILRKTAKSFGEGKLEQRLNIKPFSYIRDIEIEFNNMAQRIENLIADVKLLSSAVSHDLRTPLARIRFGIDTLQEEDDPVLRRRFEEKISNNVDEMTSLVETLLKYARLDQAMLDIKKDRIDLSQIIERSINIKSSEAKEISFKQSTDSYMVVGDLAYLSMLVNNLLENALQYCDKNVTIELSSHKNKIKMVIADDGCGVAENQRDNILKPFVRGPAHQERQQQGQQAIKGHGIGLAIVKRILDWHQGEIQISNSTKLSGAEFIIILPKYS